MNLPHLPIVTKSLSATRPYHFPNDLSSPRRARDVGALLSPVQFKAVRESQEAQQFVCCGFVCVFLVGGVGMTNHGREPVVALWWANYHTKWQTTNNRGSEVASLWFVLDAELTFFYSICFTMLHPGNLTWPLKIGLPKRKVVFQPSFFTGYVKFRGHPVVSPCYIIPLEQNWRRVGNHRRAICGSPGVWWPRSMKVGGLEVGQLPKTQKKAPENGGP